VTTSGRFFVLEGIDGCGKSTQVTRLAEERNALATFEMGATDLGSALRELILGSGQAPVPMAEALLIASDRAQHMALVVEPALLRGQDVISDRHAASTIAYQGYGRGLAMEDLLILIDLATAGRTPDLTILLDIPVTESLARRGSAPDRMEQEDLAFFERVRAGYLAQAAADPVGWIVVDATLPLDVVAAAIDNAIVERGLA